MYLFFLVSDILSFFTENILFHSNVWPQMLVCLRICCHLLGEISSFSAEVSGWACLYLDGGWRHQARLVKVQRSNVGEATCIPIQTSRGIPKSFQNQIDRLPFLCYEGEKGERNLVFVSNYQVKNLLWLPSFQPTREGLVGGSSNSN